MSLEGGLTKMRFIRSTEGWRGAAVMFTTADGSGYAFALDSARKVLAFSSVSPDGAWKTIWEIS